MSHPFWSDIYIHFLPILCYVALMSENNERQANDAHTSCH